MTNILNCYFAPVVSASTTTILFVRDVCILRVLFTTSHGNLYEYNSNTDTRVQAIQYTSTQLSFLILIFYWSFRLVIYVRSRENLTHRLYSSLTTMSQHNIQSDRLSMCEVDLIRISKF